MTKERKSMAGLPGAPEAGAPEAHGEAAVRTKAALEAARARATADVEAVEHSGRLAPIEKLVGWVTALPPVRHVLILMTIYDSAGGRLMAGGLAYGALVAVLTGLLFAFAILGYFVPAEADRQRLVGGLTGTLAPLAPMAKEGLANVAAHAGAFSIVGLAGLAWGASQFYGSLDEAIARIFVCAPARGTFDRILRGFVSVLLLVGGILSGVALAAAQSVVHSAIPDGPQGEPARLASDIGFPLVTAAVVIVAVGILYRVVPNMQVPFSALALPTLFAGLILTVLTELFVFIAPRLAGALSVFGGFAAVFAALAWLSIAFQVLLLGAAWTRLRLKDPQDCD
jgi:membrane protein